MYLIAPVVCPCTQVQVAGRRMMESDTSLLPLLMTPVVLLRAGTSRPAQLMHLAQWRAAATKLAFVNTTALSMARILIQNSERCHHYQSGSITSRVLAMIPTHAAGKDTYLIFTAL